jgi:sugar O-acyltransferase (sialic acid O-acetyltransferase NeuD family)
MANEISRIVIYGVGSPIVVDVQESLARAGIVVAAAVRNMSSEVRLLGGVDPVELVDLTAETLALPFLVPLFTPANRQRAVREAFSAGFRIGFSLVDPSASPPRSLVHGSGLYVNSGCALGAASEFGEWVFINRGASVGHHARLGDFVSIGPGAVVSGSVTLGLGAVVGAGAVVLPELTIGSNSVVGAGSVVTKDVPDNCLAVGAPARVTRTAILGFGDQSVT